jgi:hypothetical protein
LSQQAWYERSEIDKSQITSNTVPATVEVRGGREGGREGGKEGGREGRRGRFVAFGTISPVLSAIL